MFLDPHSQKGFSLPIAIFIIVIMALVGTALVALSDFGQRSVSSEIQSIRTFYAAQSGAQLAIGQLLPLDGSDPGCAAVSNPPSTADLNGCTVSLACTLLTLGSKNFYRISSTASCNFAGNASRREIEVMLKTQ